MAEITLNLAHMDLLIELPEGVSADPKLLDGGHPLHYVLKMKGQTQTYLNCVHRLLCDLPKGLKVVELCAGIGLVARTNVNDLQPSDWLGIELDQSCMPLFKQIAPWARFCLGDMYDFQPDSDIGLMICEFSNNTLPKMWLGHKRAALLERIAMARPRYWYIADVGYYWIHLPNHWPIYEAKFGVKPTRENYADLFDRYVRENLGYKVVNWTVGGGAQYFMLESV